LSAVIQTVGRDFVEEKMTAIDLIGRVVQKLRDLKQLNPTAFDQSNVTQYYQQYLIIASEHGLYDPVYARSGECEIRLEAVIQLMFTSGLFKYLQDHLERLKLKNKDPNDCPTLEELYLAAHAHETSVLKARDKSYLGWCQGKYPIYSHGQSFFAEHELSVLDISGGPKPGDAKALMATAAPQAEPEKLYQKFPTSERQQEGMEEFNKVLKLYPKYKGSPFTADEVSKYTTKWICFQCGHGHDKKIQGCDKFCKERELKKNHARGQVFYQDKVRTRKESHALAQTAAPPTPAATAANTGQPAGVRNGGVPSHGGPAGGAHPSVAQPPPAPTPGQLS